jgi:hypothetical protein
METTLDIVGWHEKLLTETVQAITHNRGAFFNERCAQ